MAGSAMRHHTRNTKILFFMTVFIGSVALNSRCQFDNRVHECKIISVPDERLCAPFVLSGERFLAHISSYSWFLPGGKIEL
jgi:hypothetical protein